MVSWSMGLQWFAFVCECMYVNVHEYVSLCQQECINMCVCTSTSV